MSANLVETKRRIQTVTSTEKITKAMKLVASVKFTHWKKRYDESKPYSLALSEMLSVVLSSLPAKTLSNVRSLLDPVEGKPVLYVVCTSTLGLCGSYNYNLFRYLDPKLSKDDTLLLLGERGERHYQTFPNPKITDYSGLLKGLEAKDVESLLSVLLEKYRSGSYSKVVLVYTSYHNSLIQSPTEEVLLPLSLPSAEKERVYPASLSPSPIAVLEALLPLTLKAKLNDRLLETSVSEEASRRNAMETATDNADDMLKTLRVDYNKARQEHITQEITEVVAGSRASLEE